MLYSFRSRPALYGGNVAALVICEAEVGSICIDVHCYVLYSLPSRPALYGGSVAALALCEAGAGSPRALDHGGAPLAAPLPPPDPLPAAMAPDWTATASLPGPPPPPPHTMLIPLEPPPHDMDSNRNLTLAHLKSEPYPLNGQPQPMDTGSQPPGQKTHAFIPCFIELFSHWRYYRNAWPSYQNNTISFMRLSRSQ